MVEDEIRDGTRIAELLEAELSGFEEPPFDRLAIQDRSPEADPTEPEAAAFSVAVDGELLFTVFLQPDRIFLEFASHQAAVAEAARDEGLRVRPRAAEPPATLLFVERGADVKRVIDVLRATLESQ